MSRRDDSGTNSGPHQFEPLFLRDLALGGAGRCKHCYEPASEHPIEGWVPARPIGDTSFRHPGLR